MNGIEARLEELGLTLPEPAAPMAAYVPAKPVGGMLFVSGQLPLRDGGVVTGRLGEGLSVEDGAAAARLCALMILAQAKACVGFEKLAGVVRLEGFVSCTPGFTDQARVVNGASELMQDVLGEAGRHARFAVGAPALPLDACVEVAGILALQE